MFDVTSQDNDNNPDFVDYTLHTPAVQQFIAANFQITPDMRISDNSFSADQDQAIRLDNLIAASGFTHRNGMVEIIWNGRAAIQAHIGS